MDENLICFKNRYKILVGKHEAKRPPGGADGRIILKRVLRNSV
jgi:hypothetical protein